MLFESLATEIVLQVYLSCTSFPSVLALASTCKRLHNIFTSSQHLPILFHAAEAQFGPLSDLTQLLTHNASQPAHIPRSVPFSAALLKQIVQHGCVAEKWSAIYPLKKWKYEYADRRCLTDDEAWRLRRAVYRLWLYARAFHNHQNPRERRDLKLVCQKRAMLLHNWRTDELAEMADVWAVMREVVANNICPSSGTIARRLKKRYPEHHSSDSVFFYNSTTFHSNTAFTPLGYDCGFEGWGDAIPHYYTTEDMLKLDPQQILWLKDHAAPNKALVEKYVRMWSESESEDGCDGGEWFANNGQTWGQTLEWVLEERGECLGEFVEGVEGGMMGVVRAEG